MRRSESGLRDDSLARRRTAGPRGNRASRNNRMHNRKAPKQRAGDPAGLRLRAAHRNFSWQQPENVMPDSLRALVASLVSGFVVATGAVAAATAGVETTLEERLASAARAHRHRLVPGGDGSSGPGWDLLLAEGRAAQMFLIGEQHGIAENARLAGALFEALVPAGYSRAVIETSPPMAQRLDNALRENGLDGLRELYARPGGEPAFFGLREEAEWLSRARAAVRGKAPVLWGVDYEVASDRILIASLQSRRKPVTALAPVQALADASTAAWREYVATRNPQVIFSFSGDPALVVAVREAWPNLGAEVAWTLDTLEETLGINRLWSQNQGWRSNERRANLLRANFLRHWRAAHEAGQSSKIFAKLGASHLMRGLNTTETFDLGSLLPELAALYGGHAFSLLVLAGPESQVAVFDPLSWSYRDGRPRSRYHAGLDPITGAAFETGFTLVDLRPLRPLLPASKRDAVDPHLMRVVHGYDALLVMTGSTPARELLHRAPPE